MSVVPRFVKRRNAIAEHLLDVGGNSVVAGLGSHLRTNSLIVWSEPSSGPLGLHRTKSNLHRAALEVEHFVIGQFDQDAIELVFVEDVKGINCRNVFFHGFSRALIAKRGALLIAVRLCERASSSR